MGDLWVQMLTRTEQDLQILTKALQAKHATEEIVGYEMMIGSEPSNVALRNDVAVIYTEMGQLDQAVLHLETRGAAAAGLTGRALQPRNDACPRSAT